MDTTIQEQMSQTGFYITKGYGCRLPEHMKDVIRLPIAGVHYLFARANQKLEAKPFSYEHDSGLIYVAAIACNKEDIGILAIQDITPHDNDFAFNPARLTLEFIPDATKEIFCESHTHVLSYYQNEFKDYSRDLIEIQGDLGSNTFHDITNFRSFPQKLQQTVFKRQNKELSFSALL